MGCYRHASGARLPVQLADKTAAEREAATLGRMLRHRQSQQPQSQPQQQDWYEEVDEGYGAVAPLPTVADMAAG